MRVRQLLSYLQDENLIVQSQLEELRGLRIGFDTIYWLRTIQMLKDPFADALGGVPPCIFETIDKELAALERAGIEPVFVFEGMAPPLQHHNFHQQMGSQQLDAAWTCLAQGQRQEAQKAFAVATSRINSDIVELVFQHLKAKGLNVFRAPYFVGAQLAHFQDILAVHGVFGQPGLLLYGNQKVIILLDATRHMFEWVDLRVLLEHWKITHDQFIDACLLAGTEYCLTYPYLNLEPFQVPGKGFRFEVAVEFIRNHTLINWMQSLSTEEMRKDYVEGYCLCKALIRHAPVLDVKLMQVRPHSSGGENGDRCPPDLEKIVGCRLNPRVYALTCSGLLSHRLPAVLATAEWNDRQPPLVDSSEYRALLQDLQEYRERAMGMVVYHCDKKIHRRQVNVQFFHKAPSQTPSEKPATTTYTPLLPNNSEVNVKPWHVTKDMLEAEERRQQAEGPVNLRFCLTWHAHTIEKGGQLISNSKPVIEDAKTLAAVTQFMFLQQIGLIGTERDMTVLGDALKDCPDKYQEPCLFALELMKFGLLTGEAFEPPEQKSFPAALKYPPPRNQTNKMITLLTRVVSLYPMKLKSDMWNAEVDFDLAAFHSMVRDLKRSLKQLIEACLAYLLLEDVKRVKLVPPDAMAAQRESSKAAPTALFPTFTVTRCCTGIVLKHILSNNISDGDLKTNLKKNFPCCADATRDIAFAVGFWKQVMRCVEHIAEPLEAQSLLEDMREADRYLDKRMAEYPQSLHL
jgi:5'-3' exonuclease